MYNKSRNGPRVSQVPLLKVRVADLFQPSSRPATASINTKGLGPARSSTTHLGQLDYNALLSLLQAHVFGEDQTHHRVLWGRIWDLSVGALT